HYQSINDLPPNARIGTSSLRRQCQVKALFPQAEILTLRGNVNTRLAKLDAGDYDAIILASAGLIRLGMAERITQHLDTEISLPAIGQGAIGIECRSDDDDINNIIKQLHDINTGICVTAERAMNARLNGGCQVPIAGFAEIDGDVLMMRGLVGDPNGSRLFRCERKGRLYEAEFIGTTIAEDLLSQGAHKVLQALYR
ncbi:partial hydroxymethylbilane synthase, partial [biofilm metagenome]